MNKIITTKADIEWLKVYFAKVDPPGKRIGEKVVKSSALMATKN